MSPRAQSLLLSAATGAAVSLVVAYFVKRELEAEFGAGAEQLQQRLTDRGSVLRTEITHEATLAAQQAVIKTLNDYGITPQLVSQVRHLASLLPG